MEWMGLPAFGAPPSVAMLGDMDISRNGAHTGGVAADLRQPRSQAERQASPGGALATNPWVVLGALAVAFIALNKG